jgi:hypothetical protein
LQEAPQDPYSWIKDEREMKMQERETQKESVTFASSKSLLGRGDLRDPLPSE